MSGKRGAKHREETRCLFSHSCGISNCLLRNFNERRTRSGTERMLWVIRIGIGTMGFPGIGRMISLHCKEMSMFLVEIERTMTGGEEG